MTNKDQNHIKLDSFWPYRAVVLADQVSRYTLSVVRAEAGLNLSQWRVLAAVAEKPGRTAAEVTTITPMDKTIVSRAVSSLIETDLIIKSPMNEDKRRQSLTATRTGLSIYKKVATHLNKTMVESFGEETTPENFIDMLEKFSAKMSEISPKTD